MKLALRFALRRRLYTPTYIECAFRRVQGCIGAEGRRPPLFSTGGRVPHSLLLWTEIRAKVNPLLQLVTY